MLWLLGVASIYFLNNFWGLFFFFPKESVRGIFLNFIWWKLNKPHKNSQKKREKSIWDIYSQLFFWFFLSSTRKFYVSFSFIHFTLQQALQINTDG